MQASQSSSRTATSGPAQAARTALDAWVREVVNWHFDPATGSPFWLDYAQKLGWDPRQRITGFQDLAQLGLFEDEWLRGGPVQRWVPRGLAGKPVFVFETGGTTGIPKTRIKMNDSATLTGMVMIGMIADGMCQRKTRMMIETMMISSVSFPFTVWIDSSISSERS